MLLGKRFEAFIEASPVSVMVRGTLERVLDPGKLGKLFDEHAVKQYTRQLTFGQCCEIMSDVVFQVVPAVGAWYKAHPGELAVTRQAVYDKLKHLELPISAALVRHSAAELRPAMKAMGIRPAAFLPKYRVRILDGNHLAGTDHRILELRRHRAAALPGQALAFYDPQWDLIDDVIPCEDGHAQERSLTEEILAALSRRECIIADRNFCTTRILFGIATRSAFFIIRQHKSNVVWKTDGKRRLLGRDERGRPIYEQAVMLFDEANDETLKARRITIKLDKPTQDGDTELHIFTNLPQEDADALKVATLYGERWTVETAFQHLTQDLRCEINTLGYPRAALFGFCLAVVAYNAVSVVKASLRAVHGKTFVEEQLSMYYVTLEVSQVSRGMDIAIEDKDWEIFGRMSVEEYAATMLELARRMDLRKYTKHKRKPTKNPTKKISGKKIKHVSTAKLLATRRL
jgi:IS4 transposase